jgi:hypothetical protein
MYSKKQLKKWARLGDRPKTTMRKIHTGKLLFVVWMPESFNVGDTADVKINGESKRKTWRGDDCLVVGPDDVHKMVSAALMWRGLRQFLCTDADGDPSFQVHVSMPRESPLTLRMEK